MRASRYAVCVALLAGAAACGDSDDGNGNGNGATATDDVVRLLTHDSFVVSDGVFEAFTEETGVRVEVLRGDDAGSLVNQAVLTRGDPQGDVLYGIDTTFLTLGLDEDLFEPYLSPALDLVPDELEIDPEHRVTPIDRGDVCINYERAYFEAPGAPPLPTSLAALADPAYRDLLVVEDPATSSPGLAFLAATVEELGDDGWEAYWTALRANGVAVAADWTDAYYGQFSGGATSEGDRPLVVSYASSPPVEVLFADPPVDEPPTGVIEATCIRQVEYAGVLAGAAHPAAAHLLVDFLLSETFQADVPLNMFVFPVRDGTPLPDVFRFAAQPADAIEVDPFELGARRADLIERWTELVLR
ncbi:MAG: thiamine ABC transporter substrate-binding protein [Actinomycetota bacterium]|nr:thiamine ABC transporter substrate-binding protein [Acidimicrobiia bacterium]MDQ3294764.1 thiamine ABC transporter substrate-binding protein [Actinomycetota bacterium]